MKQVTDKVWYSQDKTTQIPNAMGLPSVSADLVGLYFKMKTTGSEARASADTLQRRTGWGRDQLRKKQQKLWEIGWCMLLAEGQSAGGKVPKGLPRHWWLCAFPFEIPPQDVVARVLESRPLAWQPEAWARGLKASHLETRLLESRPPTRSLNNQQDLKQPKKREGHPGADAPPPPSAPPQPSQGQAILTRLNGARRLSRYAADYANTPQNRGAAILCEKAYGEKLEAAHEAFLADDSAGLIKRHHPLSILAAQPDSYMPGVVVKPKPKPECAGPGPHGGARNYAGTSWCAHCTERRNQERHP